MASTAKTVLKKTTGITGLAVAPNPHHTLTVLYGKILRALAKMPESAAYRKNTEQIITERAEAVACCADISALEEKISCGQVEELVIQAENELILARKMLTWKPWEPLLRQAPNGQWQWPPAKLN